MAPDAPARVGKEEITQGMKPVFDAMNLEIRITSFEEVRAIDNNGLTRCTYSLQAIPKAGGDTVPQSVEGGSLARILKNKGKGRVNRPREEFVSHFPHYDKDPQGPATAIILGEYKLIRVFETEEPKLFNLSKDPGERNNLADKQPEKVAELDKRLTDYLTVVNAQMPTLNPNHDPSVKANSLPGETRGGGNRGDRRERGNRRDRQNQNNRQNQR